MFLIYFCNLTYVINSFNIVQKGLKMEIEKEIELNRPSVEIPWFFDYIRDNKEKFIDIFAYTEENYIVPGDILITTQSSEDGLVQNKKILFKNYNLYDKWENDPTVLLIKQMNKEYNEQNGIIMNFTRIKDLMTDIVFLSISPDSVDSKDSSD